METTKGERSTRATEPGDAAHPKQGGPAWAPAHSPQGPRTRAGQSSKGLRAPSSAPSQHCRADAGQGRTLQGS